MPLQPGTRLGPYEVHTALGKGGMGEVYRAKDLRLKRDVAVKVLPTHLKPGSLQLAQFEREAHLLASLNHPNICSIYDVGTESGTSFIVMEHLQGETLAARIDRSPIAVNVALVYSIQIVEALDVAHSAGLVHRDIKPGNIMLTTTGVKLLDFGLAKRRLPSAAPAQTGTHVDTAQADVNDREGIVGTLHYMAPEQLAGAAVDGRSDLWAFGCVLYEMLTGRRAFTGKSLTDVITAIVSERPVVMTLERGVVPLALEQVVSKCLARNPAERWQSAAELARELRSMLPHAKDGSGKLESGPVPRKDSGALSGQQAVDAPPETAPAEPKRRTGLLVAIAAAVLLAAAAGGGWFLFGRPPAPPASDTVGILPFVNVGEAPGADYLTAGLADGIAAEIARRPGVHVVAPSMKGDSESSPDARALGASLGVNRLVTGRITVRGGRVDVDADIVDVAGGAALWSGHYSEAENNVVSLARDLTGAILVALRLEAKAQGVILTTLPSKLNPDAYRLTLRGQSALRRRDEASLKNAITLFTDAATKDSHYAAAQAGLASAYYSLAQPTVAAMRPNDALPKAKKAVTGALETDASLVDAHLTLAGLKMSYDWDWQGAGAEYDRAIALEANHAVAHAGRAQWLMNMGQSEAALTEARTATTLDPTSVVASYTLGRQLYLARRYSEAVDQLKAAIAINPQFAAAHWALGAAYEKSGRLDDAIRELQSSSTMSSDTLGHLAELGYVHARASRATEARQALDRLRMASAREYVSPFNVALVAAGLNDRDTVFTWLLRAADEHAPELTSLRADPRFDDFRSDPRFGDLLKRIGF